MAKKTKKRTNQPWTKALIADLRKNSKQKTPVSKIAKMTKRTPGAIGLRDVCSVSRWGIGGRQLPIPRARLLNFAEIRALSAQQSVSDIHIGENSNELRRRIPCKPNSRL